MKTNIYNFMNYFHNSLLCNDPNVYKDRFDFKIVNKVNNTDDIIISDTKYLLIIDKYYNQKYVISLYKIKKNNTKIIILYDSKYNTLFLFHIIEIIMINNSDKSKNIDKYKNKYDFILFQNNKYIIHVCYSNHNDYQLMNNIYSLYHQVNKKLYRFKNKLNSFYQLVFKLMHTEYGGFYNNLNETNETHLKQELYKYNLQLQRYYPCLLIRLDTYYNLPNVQCFSEYYDNDLILALYHRGICVSSIEISYKEHNSISIESFTNQNHTNKHYNTLLRSVLILLSPYLKFGLESEYSIHTIISNAINPISAWSLLKYDINIKNNNTINYDNISKLSYPYIYNIFESLNKKRREIYKQMDIIETDTIEYNEMLDLYHSYDGLCIHLPITKNNIKKASSIFDDFLQY